MFDRHRIASESGAGHRGERKEDLHHEQCRPALANPGLSTAIARGVFAFGLFCRRRRSAAQPVSGIVRFDGKTLARGTILFYPDNHTKSFGSNPTGDVILNGRFSIPRRKGPTPGNYRIAIVAERSRTERIEREANPENVGPRAETKIPSKFNADTVLEVEIKEGGIKELQIDLTSR